MTRILGMLAALLLCSGTASASDPGPPASDWLIGTWTLCEDPDNSPHDFLQFDPDGSGRVIRDDITEFRHRLSGQSVTVLVPVGGRELSIELSASPTFDALRLYSDHTGNTSLYVRADGPRAADCSIQPPDPAVSSP